MTTDLAAARAESDHVPQGASTRPRRRRSFATGLFVTTLVIAGSACGDGDTQDSPQSAPAATTPSTVSAGAVDTAPTPTTTMHMSHGAQSAATTPMTMAPASAPAETPVAIADFAFAPTPVRIRPGGTVVWTNQDPAAHSIQDKSSLAKPVSPDLAQGDTFSITYPKAGVYPYICGIHNSMEGSVEVAG